ncbi:unnamed protein product [Dimorphilus gyrociliatus]|uniref:Protein Smaug n=1 Tax=Dimorphilus gyrociliatus TaxID=2664684 RepID=A0A7I8W4V9_9ANNE|nr:unnamed protein product [Dimorphilus gyrociliatus]
MRSASCSFKDQVHDVTAQFDTWNDCEQTIALLNLLKRLRPSHARFLCRTVEQSLDNDHALMRSDAQANDSSYLQGLAQQIDTAGALSTVLAHVPLLRPGSNEAKQIYINLVKRLMQSAADAGRQTEECRQLAIYLVMHPALTQTEIQEFNAWYSKLEQQQQVAQRAAAAASNGGAGNTNGWPSASLRDSGIGLNCPLDTTCGSTLMNARPLSYSISVGATNNDSTQCVAPPTTGVNNHLGFEKHQVCATVSSPPGLGGIYDGRSHRRLARTESLVPVSLQYERNDRNNHCQLSPQSSASSSNGDEPRNSFADPQSAMRDVPAWLKQLRLHKYASLFQQMKYEDMLNISESWLTDKGVTKGARDKILLNIKKLEERSEILSELEKKVREEGSVKDALTELKLIVNTPIKPFDRAQALSSDEDLPSQITAVLGKVSSQLLMNTLDEENCTAFEQLVDKLSDHKAFTEQQQNQLKSWKSRVSSLNNRNNSFKNSQRSTRPFSSFNHYAAGGKRGAISTKRAQHSSKQPLKSNLSVPTGPRIQTTYQQLLTVETTRQQVTRTHSAPAERETEQNINARLDMLSVDLVEKVLD